MAEQENSSYGDWISSGGPYSVRSHGDHWDILGPGCVSGSDGDCLTFATDEQTALAVASYLKDRLFREQFYAVELGKAQLSHYPGWEMSIPDSWLTESKERGKGKHTQLRVEDL